MKIIIVGLDGTGALLSEAVALEHHDVVVIDEDKKKIDAVTDRANVSGICGTGVSKEILLSAGADLADVVVALTPSDESNLLICAVAKQCGTRLAVAQLNNPELYGDRESLGAQFAIDRIITPKYDTAREITRHIGLPGTVRADGFFSDEATLICVNVGQDSRLDGMLVRDVKNFLETDMLVVAIAREGKAIFPKAETKMKAGDLVCIIASNHNLSAIMYKLDLVRREVKNVLIIGGGDVAYFLADSLLKMKKTVTILEESRERCIELSEMLPKADIACTENIDPGLLEKEGLRSADVCVTLTGRDDTNMVYSMFAWSCGVKSIITKINSPSYVKILNKVNIDITISPTVISVGNIVSFIRNQAYPRVAGNDIDCMYKIAGGIAEAVEFTAYEDFKGKNIPFKSSEFTLKKDTLIAAIIRGGEVFVPNGGSVILPGDKVVVVTGSKNRFSKLNDILA